MPEDNEELSSTGTPTEEAEECSMTCVIFWRFKLQRPPFVGGIPYARFQTIKIETIQPSNALG